MKTLTAVLLFLVFTLVDSFGQTNPHKAEYQRLVGLDKVKKASDYLQQAYPQWDLRKMRGLSMFIDCKEKDPAPQGSSTGNIKDEFWRPPGWISIGIRSN